MAWTLARAVGVILFHHLSLEQNRAVGGMAREKAQRSSVGPFQGLQCVAAANADAGADSVFGVLIYFLLFPRTRNNRKEMKK